MLSRIVRSFEGENMQTQNNILGYRTDLYFHDYKLAVETVENRHSIINISHDIKRQKAIEQKLGCKFIYIDPNKKRRLMILQP